MDIRWVRSGVGRWMVATGVACSVLGCAATALQPVTDVRPDVLQRFGGRWEWSSWRQSPAVLGPGPIVVRLVDGRLRFETATTTGQLALYEGGDRRVLRGDGTDKKSGRPFEFDLRQHRGPVPADLQAGPSVFLVFAQN